MLAKCLPVFAGRIYIGIALTAERGPVNGALSANQMRPSLVALDGGTFAVFWSTLGDDGFDVFGTARLGLGAGMR